MRRSAAPSFQSGGPGKRIKFNSPLSNNKTCSPTPLPLREPEDVQGIINASHSTDGLDVNNNCCSKPDTENIFTPHLNDDGSHESLKSSSTINSNLRKSGSFRAPFRTLSNSTPVPATKSLLVKETATVTQTTPSNRSPPNFQTPSRSHQNFSTKVNRGTTDGSTAVRIEREKIVKPFKYFKAMWTKFSKKKHKTWEGDGIIIVGQSSIELRDENNKTVGKKNQCKVSYIEGICDGSSLIFSGKEVLVDEQISEELYKSGACFMSSAAPQPSPHLTTDYVCGSKGFACPQKANGSSFVTQQIPQKPKPRHDPSCPSAVVLDPETDKTVAVVLDPYLGDRMRNHQIEGIKFLYKCVMGANGSGQGAVLADDMGLGKTLQCIALIWTLLKQGPSSGPVVKKCLIITPSSLVANWKKEFKKWLGDERIKVWALSAGESRVDDFISSPLHSVLIISYEMFRKSISDILKLSWGMIVCDEGHRLKNVAAKIGEALCKLPCKRRIILSGTPVQNNLKEFYTLVNFVNPGVLGIPSAFNNVFADPIQTAQLPTATVTQREIGKARRLELSRITSTFILRRTNEVNEKYLPPKEERILFCKASPLLVARYSALIDNTSLYNISSSSILELICKLKKLCNHPCLVPSESTQREGVQNVNVDDSSKLTVTTMLLKQQVVEKGHKVVLVSNYTQTLDILGHLCDTLNMEYVRLDGSTPQTKRQNFVELFNSTHDKRMVFLLSSKAGGVGLNLIGGNVLILYDIDWNPANDQQAMARIWRDGQRRSVVIYRLLTTGTIEEKIFQRQVMKQGLSKCVVDQGTDQCSFTAEDLKDIFSYNFTTSSITHELLKCTCNGDYRPGTTTEEKDEDPEHTGIMELMRWSHSWHTDPNITFILSRQTHTKS